jgi:AcrR family transcriptional regulator
MSPSPGEELSVAPRPQRADAARNRRLILEAARRLFAERGVEQVSLEAVAHAAGVSKATLFRRFGDRQSLFLALLDEHERALQELLLHGAPPLGPGAGPRARLHAFVDGLLALSLEHREFLLASETARPLARLRTGAYVAWHRHISWLLSELRPDADASVLAHVLLGAFDAELLTALQGDGVAPGVLADAVHELVESLTTTGVSAG